MRGVRGEREQAAQPAGLAPAPRRLSAAARRSPLRDSHRRHREAGELGALLFGIRVERRAADDARRRARRPGSCRSRLPAARGCASPACRRPPAARSAPACRARPRSSPARSFSTASAVTMVPTPAWVKSSSSSEPSTRRVTRWPRPTPPATRAHRVLDGARRRGVRQAVLARQRRGLVGGELRSTCALAAGRAACRCTSAACRP